MLWFARVFNFSFGIIPIKATFQNAERQEFEQTTVDPTSQGTVCDDYDKLNRPTVPGNMQLVQHRERQSQAKSRDLSDYRYIWPVNPGYSQTSLI